MHWQDIVFTTGAIIFVLALFPSILSKDKPALSSSMTTGIVLTIFSLTYLSLSLWFSAFTTFLTALTWFTLTFQKYNQNKKQK